MLRNRLTALEQRIWDRQVESLPPQSRQLWLGARLLYCVLHDLTDPQFTMRVMGLVYTTLLSLVPFLALGFSLLKAFDVHSLAEPMLLKLFEPFGDEAPGLVKMLIGFVDNIKVGVLGTLGLGLLLFGAISLIQKVEASFNYIWKVQRSRNLLRRFSEYLSVLVVGPLVVVSVLGLTAALLNHQVVQGVLAVEPFGALLKWVGRLLPYLLISVAFAFLYAFMPNTRVKVTAALAGGVFAGVVWQTASFVFAALMKTMTGYNAIYSSFAILIFLLIWLYIGWLILLLGARVSYLVQHPEALTREPRLPPLGPALAEQLAITLLGLVASRFRTGQAAWSMTSLTRALQLPPEYVNAAAERLIDCGWLIESGDDPAVLMPTRDLGQVSVGEALASIRQSPARLQVMFDGTTLCQPAAAALAQGDAAWLERLSRVPLTSLHPE